MRRVLACLGVAVATGGLAGCGSGSDTAADAAATTAATTAISSSPASTSSSAPSTSSAPTSTSRPGPGSAVQTPSGSVTYFGQQRPAAPDAPAPQQAGTEWAAIDVQVCLDAGQPQGGDLSNDAWTVTDTGNGQTDPSSLTYNQFPAPEYPVQGYIDPGTCVRGWIVYPIVVGRDLTTVRYFPTSAPAPLASWTA